jgi:hypothetical protein
VTLLLTTAVTDAFDATHDTQTNLDDNDDSTVTHTLEKNLAARTGELTEATEALEKWNNEYLEELGTLVDIVDQCEDYGDWSHGSTLVEDSHFGKYAYELAVDIGAVTGEEAWPLNCIDWDRAVNELKQAYCSVTFDGTSYWVRN